MHIFNVSILDKEHNYKKILFSEILMFVINNNYKLNKIEDTLFINNIYNKIQI